MIIYKEIDGRIAISLRHKINKSIIVMSITEEVFPDNLKISSLRLQTMIFYQLLTQKENSTNLSLYKKNNEDLSQFIIN